MSETSVKRLRVALSCTVCKKRKVRCDKQRPCSSCIKHKTPEKCEYILETTDNTDDKYNSESVEALKERIRELEDADKRWRNGQASELPAERGITRRTNDSDKNNPQYIGFNPFDSPTSKINFYEGYNPVHTKGTSRRMNFGPFAWLSILRMDPALNRMSKYFETPEFSQLKQSIQQEEAELETENIFRKKAIIQDGYMDIQPYNPSQMVPPIAEPINSPTIDSGDTYAEDSKLLSDIIAFLPGGNIIWTSINRFFATLYPYMPILDEFMFKETMQRILGDIQFSTEPASSINIERRLDFAHLGCLLLLLRFVYISLIYNKESANNAILSNTDPSREPQELKLLMSSAIDLGAVSLAQRCLGRFNLLNKTNFVVLQFLYMMRLYRMFAPEDGDATDGGSLQMFNGLLVQMAYLLGVNREPDFLPGGVSDPRSNNLSRKLWFFMMITDTLQAYRLGNPPAIDKKYYDVKLPYYKPGNENISDLDKELHVISNFSYFEMYAYKLSKIMDLALDVRAHTPLSTFCAVLDEFELFLSDNYGDLGSFITPFEDLNFTYPFLKVMKAKNYINMKGFTLVLLFHLFLAFEKRRKHEYVFFYMRKMLIQICTDLVPWFFDLVLNNYLNFGECSDLILNPLVQLVIHRVILVLIPIYIRVNCEVYRDRTNIKFVELSRILGKIMKILMMALLQLSHKYYYAWRVTKSNRFLLSFLTKPDFYEDLPPELLLPALTDAQVDELIAIGKPLDLRFLSTDFEVFLEFTLAWPSQAHSMNSHEMDDMDSVLSLRSGSALMQNSLKMRNLPATDSTIVSPADLKFMENLEVDRIWLEVAKSKSENAKRDNEYGSVYVEPETQDPIFKNFEQFLGLNVGNEDWY